MRLLSLSILLVFIFSCSQKTEEKKSSLLSTFWKSEIARLQKEKPKVMKITTVNGKTDTLITDSIDWEKELQMFVKNDIADTDVGTYDIDTIVGNDTLLIDEGEGNFIYKFIPFKKITLEARNDEQKLREVLLLNLNSYLRLVVKDEEQLYGINKEMIYHQSGYKITGSQDIKFIDNINYKVEVKFIDK